MRKFEYSKELADVIRRFLDDDDWSYNFDENAGAFDFVLSVKRSIQRIYYRINVREDHIVVYGTFPLNAEYTNSNVMAQMAEFLCRANYGLKYGNFEMDYRDGEIRYKSFIDCENVMPSVEVVKNSIYCTATMAERYGAGILGIMFSGWTAKQAIDECEKSPDDELRSVLAEVIGGDATDHDADDTDDSAGDED